MNGALARALVALLPAAVLPFWGAAAVFVRGRSVYSFLQLIGERCLVVVVLTHITEVLNLFPWMHWGFKHSVGHYIDFCSAILGLTLFPTGYLLQALTRLPGGETPRCPDHRSYWQCVESLQQ